MGRLLEECEGRKAAGTGNIPEIKKTASCVETVSFHVRPVITFCSLSPLLPSVLRKYRLEFLQQCLS
jgi:hypothetical protein